MRTLTMAVIGITAVLSCTAASAQIMQQSSALAITSPINGTMVNPGETITVSVTVNSGTYPKGIAIIGPGITAGPLSGPAPSFTVTIPTNAESGPLKISANGIDSSGNFDSSLYVTLDVERSDMPVSLRVDPPSYHLQQGQSLPLSVFGIYADGSWHGLTQSSRLLLTSSNTAVAAVQNGSVVASGPGSATIQISYENLTASASVAVTGSGGCFPATRCKP